jgi:hypothetical protein
MSGIIGEVKAEAEKAEEWVEKEAGVIEHRVTSSALFHSAEHIAGKIDGWIETLDSGLDADVRKAYSEAAKLIKGLFK